MRLAGHGFQNCHWCLRRDYVIGAQSCGFEQALIFHQAALTPRTHDHHGHIKNLRKITDLVDMKRDSLIVHALRYDGLATVSYTTAAMPAGAFS